MYTVALIYQYHRLSDGDKKAGSATRRTDEKKKAISKPLQHTRSPMSDEDVAKLDDEADMMQAAM